MHDITLHDAFVAEGRAGTAPRQAATIEAGALWLPRNLAEKIHRAWPMPNGLSKIGQTQP